VAAPATWTVLGGVVGCEAAGGATTLATDIPTTSATTAATSFDVVVRALGTGVETRSAGIQRCGKRGFSVLGRVP
jgi:hypothetical protein